MKKAPKQGCNEKCFAEDDATELLPMENEQMLHRCIFFWGKGLKTRKTRQLCTGLSAKCGNYFRTNKRYVLRRPNLEATPRYSLKRRATFRRNRASRCPRSLHWRLADNGRERGSFPRVYMTPGWFNCSRNVDELLALVAASLR
jgi:hypothetical protein